MYYNIKVNSIIVDACLASCNHLFELMQPPANNIATQYNMQS